MTILLTEDTFETEILTEATATGKDMYIQGIFAQAEIKNRNGRVYPTAVLDPEVERYQEEFVKTNQALGELEHPERTSILAERASHLIVDLKKEGSDYIGKAKVLNTPMGNIVRGLLEGGVKIGVSTRGSGAVKMNTQGFNEVQRGFKLHTVDVVTRPSAQKAYVDYVLESESIIQTLNTMGLLKEVEEFLALKKQMKSAKSADRSQIAASKFQQFLQNIKV
jgi:hypothetical protein